LYDIIAFFKTSIITQTRIRTWVFVYHPGLSGIIPKPCLTSEKNKKDSRQACLPDRQAGMTGKNAEFVILLVR